MLTVLVGLSPDLDRALQRLVSESAVDPERFDGDTITSANLPNLCQGTTLFSDKRLIIIKDLSENKPVFSALETYFDALSANSDIHFILVEPKLDKRSTTYKKLKSAAEIHEFDDTNFSKSFNRPEQLKWLSAKADRAGLELDSKTQNFLLDHVGIDKFALLSAIDKLALIGQPATSALITDLVEPSYEQNVFTVFSLAFTDTPETLRAIDRLALSAEVPQKFFGLISNQAFLLAAIVLSNQSTETIARDFAVNPFVLKNLVPLSSRLTPVSARRLISLFAAADHNLKTTSLDPWLIIKNLLAKLPNL